MSNLRSYLAYVLAEADRAVNERLGETLEAEGVTVEQWRILRALSDGRGHSMGDLARAALMPHPTLTKAVDRLAEHALVFRRQDDDDRRRVAVFLSDRGRDLVARLDRRATDHHLEVAEAYGTQRTERLMRALERLVASLR
jgi:MarR family transcriptional regulator, organic hydroperoxide resistance regulator